MRILDRYIAKTIITSILMVLLVLVAIESFMEMVAELHYLGRGNYGILQIFEFVPLKLPTDLYTFFPVAGLLGSLMGLGKLAQSSELIVMRASGVSIARITFSVIRATIILLVFVTFVGEVVAPYLQTKAFQVKNTAQGLTLSSGAQFNVWLKNNETFIHINFVSSPTSIKNITLFSFNKLQQLQSITHAKSGVLLQNSWELQNVMTTQFFKDHTAVTKVAELPMAIHFDPTAIFQTSDRVAQDSLRQLVENIHYRRANGLAVDQFELTFWQRLLQPLATIIMICLGVPFIFGSLRSSSMGIRILTGIIFGFVYYMMNRLFGPITVVYQFPAFYAAIMPTLLFMVIYIFMARRMT